MITEVAKVSNYFKMNTQVGKYRIAQEKRWWNKCRDQSKRLELKRSAFVQESINDWIYEQENYLSRLPKELMSEVKKYVVSNYFIRLLYN